MKFFKENGFLSIEAIGAVTISLLSLMVGAEIYSNWCDNLEYNAAAQHLLAVEKGAKNYINDHYHTLVEETKKSGKISTIPIKKLIKKNYLTKSFSTTNSFRQTYTVKVKKAPPVNATPQLQAIILTEGGSPISELGVRKIATMLGAQGGYFTEELGQRVIQGALGAWSEKATAFGFDPGNGHLAAALFFIDGRSASRDFLYRKPVPGKPELNQMQTDLAMGHQDIENAKNIKTKGLFASDQIEADSIHSKKRLSTEEFLQIDGVAEEDAPCSGKVFGTSQSGRLLFCKSNQWRLVSNPHLLKVLELGEKVCTTDRNTSRITKCPAGYSLTGAGHDIEYLSNKPDHGQLISYPMSTLSEDPRDRWMVDVSKMTDTCATPVVICMRIIETSVEDYYDNLLSKKMP